MTLLAVLGVLYSQAAFAQSARKFTNKPIIVRLCPATCRAVNGHGLRPGGNVSVFENRGGWVRVSKYLDRKALVPSFGNKITKKPALWVPAANLASNKAAAKPAAKKTTPAAPKKPSKVTKRVSVIDRIARLQRVPSPVFRPANVNGNSDAQPVPTTVSEPVATTTTAVAVSEPTTNPEPVKKPVVIDSTPVTSVAKGTDSKQTLTWEEVQAKIARQAAGKSTPIASAGPTEADKAKQAAAEKAKAAAAVKAKQAAVEKAKAAATAKAKQAAVEKAKAAATAKAKQAAAEKAKAAAAAKAKQSAAEKAKAAAAAKAKQSAAEKAKAAAAAKAKQAAADKAKAAAVAKTKQAAADKAKAAEAAKAKKAVEDKTRIAAETKKKLEEQAKAAEAAKQAENAKVAVVLPPKKVEPAAVKEPEPTFKSAKADPIALGARPKTLTKKLQDKRLKKLPGSKSNTPKKVVIALRHFALSLLDSGECKGIEKGGASAVPGMLYIACSDDPTYLRQFPLEEETW